MEILQPGQVLLFVFIFSLPGCAGIPPVSADLSTEPGKKN